MQTATRNVIPVDFRARSRIRAGITARTAQVPRLPIECAPPATVGLKESKVFVFFWRPPARGGGGEYLGGRWDWGWTMFVWTSDAAVGAAWTELVEERGYVAERLTRDAFAMFVRRAGEIGGLLLDGELDEDGGIIKAEADQLVTRDEALRILRG